MPRFHNYLLFAALGLVACSSKKNNTPTPDAPNVQVDAAGPTCLTPTLGAVDINDPGDGTYIAWSGDATPDVSGASGNTSIYKYEFYTGTGLDPLGTGPIDLSAGTQANYKSCSACVRMISSDASGAVAKQFFQTGGTLTLTEDPFLNSKMVGTITGLTLTEVTIDSANGYTSTPVSGGTCISVGNVTLNHDVVPNAWTCDHAKYNDGTTCDCACGLADPDCDTASNPVAGCTGAQVCVNAACTDTCNVNVGPVGCTTGTCGYQTSTQDICYTDATVVDPAALGGTCASTTPLLCAVSNTVATGVCDDFIANDQKCRKACDANADCLGTENCLSLFSTVTKGFCAPKATQDTCQAAGTVVVNGAAVNGDSTYALSNYNLGLEPTACDGFSQKGPDVVYKVALTAGQAITVTLDQVTNANFDPSVAIVGPDTGTAGSVCDVSPIGCLKGADTNTGGMGETLAYTATTAGTYFLIVDSFSYPGGTFRLTVTSP